MTALSVTDVSQNIEGVQALANVSFEVTPGERRLIIGPNGAGKTTLFNILAGSYAASGGQVALFGRDISGLPAHARARLGLSRTFQITNLFYRLTVLENILLALQAGKGAISPALRLLQQDRALLTRADALLEQWELGEFAKHAAQDISYGQQRQLDILLAMAVEPRVLLLDEPTAGLSAAEVPRVKTILRSLPRDTTVLMIEHDMDVAFEFADRITVLHQGRLLAEGNVEAIRNNPQVTEIYLGSD
ncbi:MAG: ABC transporter ATP-binding protein [Xanthobacteraceae bacterium]